jgi:sterol desaturase/sphingolipid hydroxylase (fatty acid hydroxylase superfamily)
VSDLEFYGKAVLALIGVLAVLGVIIGGVILMFRQKHQQNLALTPYDPKGAFRKTFKEYIVKELIETLLGLLILVPIAIMLLGAFIGYLIFGWKQLLSALS